MWKIAHHVWLTALILLLSLSVGWAQQTSTQQEPSSQRPSDTRTSPPATPLPPLSASPRTGQSSEASQDDGQSQSSSEPARRTLSGAEQYTLETMGQSHNYFIPIFQVTQSADTNGTNQYGGSTLESFTSVNGSFSLKHVWSHYNFVANYSGSGFLYNKDISSSSSAHAFNLSQTINGSRSSLLLSDAVSYLPESAFGYSRFAGSGSFGGGLGGLYNVSTSGLNGQYIPNQSILTGDSSRISNSAVAQYEYDLSPLSSLTFTGSYGMLRFPSSNFIDSDSGIFSAGYNHVIGRRNTIAVSYVGTIFRYDQPGSGNFINNTVALIYGHQISHLFALRLGGGPQYNTFGSGASGKTQLSWYATASLAYSLPRTRFALSFRHYTTAGSGVFVGAQTDNVGLTAGRQLSRMWSAEVNMGYSYNKSLQGTATEPTFNTWYATANLQRPLGRHMGLFLSYNLQQQSTGNPLCIGSGCSSFFTRNYFSIGFSWHPRAVELGGY